MSNLLLNCLWRIALSTLTIRKLTFFVALGVFVPTLVSVPVQAQTSSGPDYSNVTDFLNGQRTLLYVTDVQIFRINNRPAYEGIDKDSNIVQVPMSNSNGSANNLPLTGQSNSVFSADASKQPLTFSAHMFDQRSASTLTAVSNFQSSGKFALWLQNVDSLNGGPGWWSPLNGNPTVAAGAVADFTQDGYDDLALAFDDGTLLVMTPQDTTNVFKNFYESSTTVDVFKALTAGDFKGDGQREIAGLNVQPDGSLKLEIFTVNPSTSSLATKLATSLSLKMPDGVSTSNPITYVSMARGRFNSAGHDQLAITFAANGGAPIVEIVDFDFNTLNPIEGPQWNSSGTNIPGGYLQVQTGAFALPGNPYDQVVLHISSTAPNGRLFEVLSADPTSLALTGHSGITYNQYGCAAPNGVQVGNFDHRQPDSSNGSQTQPNLNAQIAFLYCDGGNPYPGGSNDFIGYGLNIYSVDPSTLAIQIAPVGGMDLSSQVWTETDQGANGGAPISINIVATDLQGRSVMLGEPTKISIANSIQPSTVIGVPPMHVDFIDPGDGNGPRVFNVSVVPDGFKTTYNQENSSSYASSNTNTTSWSFGAKETLSAGFTIGDPDTDFLKVSDTFTAAQDLKQSHENDHGTYTGKSFNISATTGFGDEVSYTDSAFNIWTYPVIGQTVCPAKPAACPPNGVPLTIQFSAPDGDAIQEAVQGQGLQWYQPPWEPGNIFSYPANLDQLKARYPSLTQLTSDTTGFLTDGSTLTQTATWTTSNEDSQSTGIEQNYSYDNDFSVSGGFEIADLGGAEGSVGLDLSGSTGFSNLIKGTTTLGKSMGVQISKPGTFPPFQNYGYSVKPYILGNMQPGGMVDNQPLSTDIQTIGLLRTVFTADPLSADPGAGGWWLQAYTAAPDVALNHPSRWTYSTTNQPNGGDPPPNCLLTGDGKSMDCAELSTRSPKNPWLDVFHQMRGFFISSGVSPGQGPQLQQAKAGDVLTLQTRVYNYSLADMPAGTEVHARFYYTLWDHTRNLAVDGTGYLINEETVGAIPKFSESSGASAQPNWALVSTTFDTSKFDSISTGGKYLVFWVVVWMQDTNGNLVGEMPGHGITGIPGTLASFADAANLEECQSDGSCYSNNVGLFKEQFYLGPKLLGAPTPGSIAASASIDMGKVDVSEHKLTPRDTTVLSATLTARGGSVSGVSVNFYDGDPAKNGRLVAVERVPHLESNSPHVVQTTFKTNGCGLHQLFAVVNHGRPSEIVRRAQPVQVACKGF